MRTLNRLSFEAKFLIFGAVIIAAVLIIINSQSLFQAVDQWFHPVIEYRVELTVSPADFASAYDNLGVKPTTDLIADRQFTAQALQPSNGMVLAHDIHKDEGGIITAVWTSGDEVLGIDEPVVYRLYDKFLNERGNGVTIQSLQPGDHVVVWQSDDRPITVPGIGLVTFPIYWDEASTLAVYRVGADGDTQYPLPSPPGP